MKRRRFLQIVAGAAAAPGALAAQGWRGRAFGADLSIRATGALPLAEITAEIAAIEARFSLFAESELTRLNRAGCVPGSAQMRAVLALAGRVHDATGGAFDPTVGALWQALAAGGDGRDERAKIGWQKVEIGGEIKIGAGQSLTLNGIVQGYAADRVAAICARHGLGPCLIDMGEFAALGGPFHLGIEDPRAGLVGRRTLSSGAMATSSPGSLALPGGSHILGPRGEGPLWSTVTVEGPSAALCDAASTGFVLMGRNAIARAGRGMGLHAVTLVDFEGNLETLRL